MMGLTAKQQECLHLIDAGLRDTGRAPSTAELAVGLSLKSKSGVCRLLDGLEERGAIRRLRNRARAIEIVPENESRTVVIGQSVWNSLVAYAIGERISIETAVNQFIRDGLESA